MITGRGSDYLTSSKKYQETKVLIKGGIRAVGGGPRSSQKGKNHEGNPLLGRTGAHSHDIKKPQIPKILKGKGELDKLQS